MQATKGYGHAQSELLSLQVAAHVPTRSKSDCVKHFIQLPFGDAYQVVPDQLEPSAGATGGVQDVDSGVTPVSDAEAATSSDHLVENRAIGSADAHGAMQGTDATVAAHDLVSPFTDTSHPLFAQVRWQWSGGFNCKILFLYPLD